MKRFVLMIGILLSLGTVSTSAYSHSYWGYSPNGIRFSYAVEYGIYTLCNYEVYRLSDGVVTKVIYKKYITRKFYGCPLSY